MARFVEGYADKIVVPDGSREIQVFDDALPGFGIRKFASGRTSYFVKYNVGNQQRKLTLGAVVQGNLAEMRKKASNVLARSRLGQDVVAEKRAEQGKKSGAIGTLIQAYLEEKARHVRARYFKELKRQLERDWKPIHRQMVGQPTRSTIVEILDDLCTSLGPVAADRSRVALSGFYGWAIERSYCESNPTINIAARSLASGRERVLSETELVEIWMACADDDYGRIVKLLLLTGQRREEIGGLRSEELDQARRLIDLPSHRVKNGRPHLVPLAPTALALIPAAQKDRDFLFGRGGGGFSGWSKSKARLDTRIAKSRVAAGNTKPMERWVLHDLRRSFVTHVNERKIAHPHVVEAIVNHASGQFAGVAGIYNKALYLDERRDALAAWGEHVARLINARGSSP